MPLVYRRRVPPFLWQPDSPLHFHASVSASATAAGTGSFIPRAFGNMPAGLLNGFRLVVVARPADELQERQTLQPPRHVGSNLPVRAQQTAQDSRVGHTRRFRRRLRGTADPRRAGHALPPSPLWGRTRDAGPDRGKEGWDGWGAEGRGGRGHCVEGWVCTAVFLVFFSPPPTQGDFLGGIC